MGAGAFAAAAVVVGAASLFASRSWLRAGAFCCLLVALGAVWWASLGAPRPVLLGVPSGTVAAFTLDEPHAIYVWLLAPGARAPIALALPWNEAAAAALHDAAQEAKRRGTRVKMGRPGRGGAHGAGDAAGTAMFYPAPGPALPPKHVPAADPAGER